MKLPKIPALAGSAWLALAPLALTAPALQTGLLAHLPMRDDLRDHSPAQHAVEVSGRVTLRDGAAYFAGREDWLELPFIPLHGRPFAVAVWLKPTGDLPTYGVVLQWDRQERGHVLQLMIRDGLRPWLGFYVDDVVSPLSLSNAGSWQHVTFQYDGRDQQIWINGRLICRRVAKPFRGTQGKTCIGKDPRWRNVPAGDFQGWMSDFRLYDRALAFEEIRVLAESVPRAIPAPAVAGIPAPQMAGSVAPAGASDIPLLSIDAAKMTLRGTPGAEYQVEASEDLVAWEALGTLPVGSGGTVEFVDEEAHRFQRRFYRLRLLEAK